MRFLLLMLFNNDLFCTITLVRDALHALKNLNLPNVATSKLKCEKYYFIIFMLGYTS